MHCEMYLYIMYLYILVSLSVQWTLVDTLCPGLSFMLLYTVYVQVSSMFLECVCVCVLFIFAYCLHSQVTPFLYPSASHFRSTSPSLPPYQTMPKAHWIDTIIIIDSSLCIAAARLKRTLLSSLHGFRRFLEVFGSGALTCDNKIAPWCPMHHFSTIEFKLLIKYRLGMFCPVGLPWVCSR